MTPERGKQIITTIDPIYLRAIHDKHVGFNKITSKDMLEFLFATYGNISHIDYDNNDKKMKAAWNPA